MSIKLLAVQMEQSTFPCMNFYEMTESYMKIILTTLKRRAMFAKEWPLILFSYDLYTLSTL